MYKEKIVKETAGMETPLYVYDMTLLENTLQVVRNSAERYNYIIHYALKANFEVPITELISRYGLGADCVSGNEIRFAIEHGFASSSIVFAGVGKTDNEINYAIEQDIYCFNCESAQELYVINEIATQHNKVVQVALRVNPDIDPRTHKYISTGKKESKFGIAYDEIKEILGQLKFLKNITIIGIHFHIGSQITDLNVFVELCSKANDIISWFETKGVLFSDINMGGGLGINYTSPDSEPIPDFEKYFSIFDKHLKTKKGQKVHFELGRSIVGQCGSLITRVLFNKRTANNKNFVIVDAGMTDLLRPALYQAEHRIDALTSEGECTEYTIGGPVCESSDIFRYNILLPSLKRGDLLAIRSTGAYGMSMASRYNLRSQTKSVFRQI